MRCPLLEFNGGLQPNRRGPNIRHSSVGTGAVDSLFFKHPGGDAW